MSVAPPQSLLSGVFISCRWPTELLGRAFGAAPAAEARSGSGAGPAASRGERSEGPSESVATPHFGDIAARAAAEVPGWSSIQLRMPREGAAAMVQQPPRASSPYCQSSSVNT